MFFIIAHSNPFIDMLEDWPYWSPIPIGVFLLLIAIFPLKKRKRLVLAGIGILLLIISWILTNFY